MSAIEDETPLPPATASPAIGGPDRRVVATATPETVTISSIGQNDVPVVAASTSGDTLEPPADVDLAGIWQGGAGLGEAAGTTLLVGHVNYVGQGNGAFHDLAKVRPGSTLVTADAAGSATTWAVTKVTTTVKAAGVDPAAFAGRAGPRRLVLVTCGGKLDRATRSYLNNVYVWASPSKA